MKIYFVRHGQSELNIENRDQGPDGPLSELGRDQAAFVAKRFSDIPIDLIVSSPYERAKETATIINSHLNKELIFSDLLVERRSATELVGMPFDDPEHIRITALIRAKRSVDPHWHYDDEENFVDVRTRAIQALTYLGALGKDEILAVTHGGFLKTVIAVMIMGEEMTYAEYLKFYVTLMTQNTGITLVEHRTDQLGTERWRLIAWNDHAHL